VRRMYFLAHRRSLLAGPHGRRDEWTPWTTFGVFFIVYSFIHMCIHCLGHLSPLPSGSSLPPATTLASRQNLFFPLLQFCWREDISDNKKDIVFLLVWDKDSYTERFLALLPCTCVLQPTLVHFYQTSSLLPSPLPIVASASLRLLYSLLYSKHINHRSLFFELQYVPIKYLKLKYNTLFISWILFLSYVCVRKRETKR
jgi:hypothetical protein